MLTETELHRYFERHGLSPDAVAYITGTRNSQPSRMVGVHARTNLCSWFYSEKMGRTISTESRTAERPLVIQSEFDPRILEFWDQPEPVSVQRHTRKGHARRSSYTPDFLLLRKDGPVVVEVKTTDAVSKLTTSAPKDWVARDDGGYDFLPAAAFFSGIGLKFEVFVASRDLRFRVLNQEVILRARQANVAEIEGRNLERAFSDSFCWSLYDLRERLRLNDYTGLIQCIDKSRLFIDLDEAMLTEPRACYVVRRKELLPFVAEFQGPKIYHDNVLTEVEVDRMPSSAYAEAALSRLERIESGESTRTVRRWRAMRDKGIKEGLSAFQSVIPRWFFSGNKCRKINEQVDKFLYRHFFEDHAPRHGISDYRSYIRYRVRAQKEHPAYPPVSRTTFILRLRAIPPEKLAILREGRRKANALSAPSDPLQRQLKAQLGWQRAAIDHYKADIYLVFFDSDDCPYAIRPWLTAMIDLATGCVLAFSVSFQDPSRRSVSKVMRDCVRRHQRLPREIVVDRASDFRSVYFSALLAHSKIELVSRPASHSRYGGEVEGLFGEFKKQWISQRPGNTTDFKNAREVDGKMKPKELAVLTPHDFYREFEAFISWRDSNPRGMSIEAPNKLLSRHMREFPFVGIQQKYDSQYLLATAVDTKDYKLDLQRGIHIGPSWYWSPELATLRGKKSSLEVRVDPENPHVVYGLVNGQWIPCYGSRINQFSALDPISQWVEGLIAIDAFGARQRVKRQADEEVVRIIQRMTESSFEDGRSQVAMLPSSHEDEESEEESVFNLLKTAKLQSLETESWEVRHDWKN